MHNDRNEIRCRVRKHPFVIRVRAGTEIGIFKGVLRALNCPQSVHFWWSEREKVLLIGAAGGKTDSSYQIPESHYNRRNGVRFSDKKLMRMITILTGWEDKSEHKLIGEFVPELDMVAFRISDAVPEVLINA